MKTFATILLLFLATLGSAWAQDRSWVQIEAHPSQAEAEARARAYAGAFPDVAAFRIGSGWYAIALGPFPNDRAQATLRRMRGERLIPRDSFVSDGENFREQVWPAGTVMTPGTPEAPETMAAAAPPPAPPAPVDETPAEARRAERDLDRETRALVQTALQWEGHYAQSIDAAFGPGTRRAMAGWQTAQGYDPTGILTTRQREALLAGYRADIDKLGMRATEEAEAGIRIEMPMGLVQFDRYEPPFVHFASRGDSGVRVLLISQRGDQATLYGLYDIMQTLEIVPLGGERTRDARSFTLTGRNARLHSYTHAKLIGGTIKGFTLIWPPAEDALMTRAAMMMRDSLESVPNAALDETLGEASEDQRADMLSGLEIRRPEATHSGFFVDASGRVLTVDSGLTDCQRITIGHDVEATLAAQDTGLGLAILQPVAALAPIEYARFQDGVPRLRSDVAVAGFSYGEVLDLPVLTYGTLADLKGLDGEETVTRLDIEALPGDTGGPVLDVTGAVMGVLLAPSEGARQLPQTVRYAADIPAIGAFLTQSGVEMRAAETGSALSPALLTRRAADMTVPVSCWN